MNKKSITLLVFIMLGVSLMAQQSVNVTDAMGRKQGSWRKTNSDGVLLYTGQFKDDVPVGEFRYYYDNGKTRAVSQMGTGGPVVETILYHKTGYRMAQGFYYDKKKNGVWLYFNKHGYKIADSFYRQGVADSVWHTWYPDGQLTEVVHYTMGVKHGPWKQYYDNGDIKLQAQYDQGTLQGQTVYYYRKNKILMAGRHNKGLRVGKWVRFYDTGITEREEEYVNGQLIQANYYNPKGESIPKPVQEMGDTLR